MKTNNLLKAILEDRSGATAVEYGLIAALIVIAMISSLNTFANETVGMWGRVINDMSEVTDGL
ncbi:MAG TPA: Flp family type IVb pilin [Sphingomonadaceae bacterium]|nr:Flp family type IVb pilin [Sphingomonadaceae bacterium]